MKMLVGLVLFLFYTAAHAQAGVIPNFQSPPSVQTPPMVGSMYYTTQYLTTVVGGVGQSKLGFVKKAGAVLRAFTGSTGYEACGMLSYSSERQQYAVRLYTNELSVACNSPTSSMEEGFSSVQESIHSHPFKASSNGTVRLSLRDRQFAYDHWGLLLEYAPLNPSFSAYDAQLGPGWLIYDTNILYQDGRHAKHMGTL